MTEPHADIYPVQLADASTPLPIARQAVGMARAFVAEAVREVLRKDLQDTLHDALHAGDFAELAAAAKNAQDHIDTLILVTSELVTNAAKYGHEFLPDGGRNLNLKVGIWHRFAIISVDDRDPRIRPPVVHDDTDLPESGRGLFIVQTLAERFWWQQKVASKNANAAIVRPGAVLTDADTALLDKLEASDAF